MPFVSHFAHSDWANRGVFYASDFDSKRFLAQVKYSSKSNG